MLFPRLHDFDENTKGIPEFWLTIFKNVDLLSEMVQDYDEPILKHLNDIQLKFHDQPMGFTLEFYFSENEFFTNKVLTKYYEMKCAPDKEDPFSFEGPEIFKCKVRERLWLKKFLIQYIHFQKLGNFIENVMPNTKIITGLYHRLEEGQERYSKNHQEEAEAQVTRSC